MDLGHSGDAGTTDASAITCESTCDRVIACGLASSDKRAQCLAQCIGVDQGTLACVANATCQNIPSCAPTQIPDGSIDDFMNTSEIEECQQVCGNIQFFECIDAKELSTCRNLCETAPRTKRNNFTACGRGAGGSCHQGNGGPSRDCYLVFVGD